MKGSALQHKRKTRRGAMQANGQARTSCQRAHWAPQVAALTISGIYGGAAQNGRSAPSSTADTGASQGGYRRLSLLTVHAQRQHAFSTY
eukprot:4109428-Pleurochrysis_carterae.AAC.1